VARIFISAPSEAVDDIVRTRLNRDWLKDMPDEELAVIDIRRSDLDSFDLPDKLEQIAWLVRWQTFEATIAITTLHGESRITSVESTVAVVDPWHFGWVVGDDYIDASADSPS
jgi:hypothetical protein